MYLCLRLIKSCSFPRYDEDTEIVAGAVPKFGRLVVWQSSISYLPRPPSIAFKKGQLLLHVQFTKSKEKMLQGHAEIVASKNERKAAYNAGFVGSDKPAPANIDVAQHFVSERKSTQGKRILVFDDLFDKEDLDKLRVFIFKHGTYYYDDSDEGDNDSDNVQWIAGFEINHYIQSRLWNIMQQVGQSFVPISSTSYHKHKQLSHDFLLKLFLQIKQIERCSFCGI